MRKYQKIAMMFVLSITFVLAGCGTGESSDSSSKTTNKKEVKSDDPMDNIGIGPITSLTLSDEIDMEMAAQGKDIFDKMCTACHKPTAKFIGPAPLGVLERRSPEWVMNMILNPEEMTQKDPVARNLMIKFNGSPMANQNLKEEEARAILEYFRILEPA